MGLGVRGRMKEKREGRRKRGKNETKKKKSGIRVGWHLLRHLTFFWSSSFSTGCPLLLSLSLSQPLRHLASLSKFLFILFTFLCPVPSGFQSTGTSGWARSLEQRHVHPESSPPPSIPSVTLSHSSIWGLGHPGSPGDIPNLQAPAWNVSEVTAAHSFCRPQHE